MSSPGNVKKLACDLANLQLAMPSPVLPKRNLSPVSVAQLQSDSRESSPRRRSFFSRSVSNEQHVQDKDPKDVVKRLSPIRELTGREDLNEIEKLHTFYSECLSILTASIETKVPTKEKAIKKYEKKNNYRAELEVRLRTLDQLSRARILQKEALPLAEQKSKKRELETLVAKLNDQSAPRQEELAARLEEINRLVQGIPPCDKRNAVPLICTAIQELWRTGATTAISEDGVQLQLIRSDAADKFAKVDDKDAALRFKTLFLLFQKYSGNAAVLPSEIEDWTFDKCQKWAATVSSFDDNVQMIRLKIDDTTDEEKTPEFLRETFKPLVNEELPDTSKWSVNDWLQWVETKRVFNQKMQRLLRSCSQAFFTGSLPKKEIMNDFPNLNFLDGENKLSASFAAGSQQLHRTFSRSGSSELQIVLPIDFKSKTRDLYAKVIVSYTIHFDSEMNGVKLTCKSTPPIKIART